MLKIKLLHPDILASLGRLGHGSQILIADGNYAFDTNTSSTATKVYLNLAPGTVKVTEVLQVLVDMIPIESAIFMAPPDNTRQPIYDDFEKLLPESTEKTKKKRFDFYAKAKSPNTGLVIATGETRRFANILLTIGVVK